MAQQLIRGGGTIDTLTPAELHDFLRQQQEIQDTRDREKYRAIKLLRRDSSLTTPALTRITTNDSITPESGYIWCVLMVSAQLASSGSFQAFITSDTDTTKTAASQRRLVASTSTNNQYPALPIPKNACILLPGEGLFLNASANIQSYFLAGWYLPEEKQGLLL